MVGAGDPTQARNASCRNQRASADARPSAGWVRLAVWNGPYVARVGVVLAVLAAFAAAVCYGVASVLQSISARRSAVGDGPYPRLVVLVLGGPALGAGGFVGPVRFLASGGGVR